MRFVSTGFHGLIDYLTATTLLASPWMFGFAGYDVYATAVVIFIGAVTLLYSIFTSYELGLTRDGLSTRAHLVMDAIAGAVLVVSPWALDFADEVYLPHVIIGGSEILFALITRTRSGIEIERDNNRNRGAGSRDGNVSGTPNAGGAGTTTPRSTTTSL